MIEPKRKNDLLTAKEFADTHGLDIDKVKLAMKKLEGLMMPPPKGSQNHNKVPVIVHPGSKRSQPCVNVDADDIVIAKVHALKTQGQQK